mmetsp:Transcript_23985/g.64883  ORF Transcript_23985/g.64883 Transcript_23985/m.64883 type:complete len:218 (+) Transcript_23985:2438-3091(+)
MPCSSPTPACTEKRRSAPRRIRPCRRTTRRTVFSSSSPGPTSWRVASTHFWTTLSTLIHAFNVWACTRPLRCKSVYRTALSASVTSSRRPWLRCITPPAFWGRVSIASTARATTRTTPTGRARSTELATRVTGAAMACRLAASPSRPAWAGVWGPLFEGRGLCVLRAPGAAGARLCVRVHISRVWGRARIAPQPCSLSAATLCPAPCRGALDGRLHK